MRTGSFLVKAPSGLSLDISIIFLDGPAGGELSNVNRWRRQIELSSWSDLELNQNKFKVKTPIGLAHVVEFSSDKQLIQGLLSFLLMYYLFQPL